MEDKTLEKPTLDVLLDHNLHDLVQSMASKFNKSYGKRGIYSTMITHEDLATEGYVGVTVAYPSFNPDLGASDNVAQSFRTYAYPYIKSAMQTYCKKFSHALSISEKAARLHFQDITEIGTIYIDQLEENEEFDIPVASGIKFDSDIEDYLFIGFTNFERELMRDHIICDYSLQEVARRHGLSKSRVGEIVRDLTQRMKGRAEKYVQDY
jgi:RNA polymerase sigma factor (sigma-70 family)